ncbi:MAG: hypothetical protein WC632_00890 [Candidatus Margulisiibacteriota bacterium]
MIEKIRLNSLCRQGRAFSIINEHYKNDALPAHFKVLGGTGKTDKFGAAFDGATQGVLAGILVTDDNQSLYAYREQRTSEILSSCEYCCRLSINITELDLNANLVRTFSSDLGLIYMGFDYPYRSVKTILAVSPFSNFDIESIKRFLGCLEGTAKNPLTKSIGEVLREFRSSFSSGPVLDEILALPFFHTQAELDEEAEREAQEWKEIIAGNKSSVLAGSLNELDIIKMQIDQTMLNAMRENSGAKSEEEFYQWLTTPHPRDAALLHNIKLVDWSEYWGFWRSTYAGIGVAIPC